MNIWQLGRILRRQWLICGVGIVLTALFLLHVYRLPGLYFEQVNIIFLAPDQGDKNTYQNTSYGLIGAAGVVATVVGGADAGAHPVSDNTTLVGTGVKHGYSVVLPNSGGQWATNYTKPVLDVQAVGTSEGEVLSLMKQAQDKVNAELVRRQNLLGVSERNRITTRINPPIPFVLHSKGSQVRALAVAGLLGMGLTGAVAIAIDSRWPRRRRLQQDPTTSAELPIKEFQPAAG